ATTPAVTKTAPALLPTKLITGQIVAAQIKEKKDYGVTVKIDGETALLKADQFAGGCNPGRRAAFSNAKVGDELAVEVVSIRPPSADDKRKVKSNRVQVSQRSIQDACVLANLVTATDTTEGTILTGRVKEVRKDFALIELTEGAAAGYLAILHALHVPGADRKIRDRFIETLKVGDVVTGECLKCDKLPEAHVDLRIAITLTAEASRTTKAALQDTTKVYKGTAGRSRDGGIEVVFGPSDAPMTGILPNHEVPHATKNGGSVRVKIASISGDRITLTRKGV
nr:hypothetical protein [Candidatus Melainabacteria bacterium]